MRFSVADCTEEDGPLRRGCLVIEPSAFEDSSMVKKV
jgi:hypothetical protein